MEQTLARRQFFNLVGRMAVSAFAIATLPNAVKIVEMIACPAPVHPLMWHGVPMLTDTNIAEEIYLFDRFLQDEYAQGIVDLLNLPHEPWHSLRVKYATR